MIAIIGSNGQLGWKLVQQAEKKRTAKPDC